MIQMFIKYFAIFKYFFFFTIYPSLGFIKSKCKNKNDGGENS